MKTLILTEKPSVARDFAKALDVRGKREGYMENEQYIITWAIGHLVELLEPEDYDSKWKKWHLDNLPVIPDEFRYKPISNTEKQLRVIQSLLQKGAFDKVVIATDAGREGEVIARTILLSSGFKDNAKLSRFWTSQALTPEVVKEGMESVKAASEYERLWKAGQCRQIADWLVGMNGSRAATVKMNDLFSVGRVQTAVLSLLADRRREREKFKPEPYWVLRALFSNEKGSWWGTWFKEDQTRFNAQKEADDILAKIAGQTGAVLSVKKQKKKQPPPLLYSLTDLQQEANRKFGFSAENTLNIAQDLYENKKCLSYPRTDSKVLGSKNVGMVKNIVKKLSQPYKKYFAGIEEPLIAASNKRVFNDAKLTDHHALIPLEAIPKTANPEEFKLYGLVLKRFAAAFYPDCEYEQTEILTEVEKEKFRTSGRRILKPGWQVVYEDGPPEEKDAPSPDDEAEPENLPPLVKGDTAAVGETKLEEKKTTPPPEYSEALLLKDMTNPGRYVSEEELKKIYRGDVGLGTQATRAQIIETLLSRGYAERKKKHIIATDKGCHLVEVLRQFKIARALTSPEETARWEESLNRIAQGQGSDKEFLDEIKAFVVQTVDEFKANPQSVFVTRRAVFGKCPACGGDIIKGKKDYGCSNWKAEKGACRFVIPSVISGRMISSHILSELLDKKKAGPVVGFVSEQGERFSGILKLVKENDVWQVIIASGSPGAPHPSAAQSENAVGICPSCGGEIIKSEKAYGCSNRRENGGCRFVIWRTIAQKEIPKEAVAQLLENGVTDMIAGFISRKGTEFSAKLKLEDQGFGPPKVVFDFSEKDR